MNDFYKCIAKYLFSLGIIVSLFLIGFGVILLLFPQVLMDILRYVIAALCIAFGAYFIVAVIISLIKSRDGIASDKKKRSKIKHKKRTASE